MTPTWLTTVSTLSLLVGLACAGWLAVDVVRRPPRMGIMAVVWPVCALFGSLLLLWFYLRFGRSRPRDAPEPADDEGHGDHETPMAIAVAKGALHCGSGCTIGDVVGETAAFAFPAVLAPLGYPGLFGEPIWATWILDFILAFVIGIAFQYFAIAPMRDLGVAEGIRAAVKADTLSLTAWQVGMYGVMAVAMFAVYRPWLGHTPAVNTSTFWFTMQVAMIGGFLTAYPMNWLLIRKGVKEQM